MTKEQEQAIKDKIEFVRIRAERDESDFSRIIKWIVAGIKAYDEMKDAAEVKAAVNAVNEKKAAENNDSDTYVVFRPRDKKGSEMLVFNSSEEMIKKLVEQYNAAIAIDEDRLKIADFEHAQTVHLAHLESTHIVLGNIIGHCDCKTFKRG